MKKATLVENFKQADVPDEDLSLNKLKEHFNEHNYQEVLNERHDVEHNSRLNVGINDRRDSLRGLRNESHDEKPNQQPDPPPYLEGMDLPEDEHVNPPQSAESISLHSSSEDSRVPSINSNLFLPTANAVPNRDFMYLGTETVIDGVVVRNQGRPKKIFEIVSFTFFSLFIIITAVILTPRRDSLEGSPESPSLGPSPSTSISTLPTTTFNYDGFVEEIALQVTREQELYDPTTIQYKVWKFLVAKMPDLVESGQLHINDTIHITQLYTLAVIHSSQMPEALRLQVFNPSRPFTINHECDLVFYACNDNLELTSAFLNNRESTEGKGGRLATEIGALPELRQISFKRNGLTSSIPSEIGNLKHLRSLELSGNALTGKIPTELGQLESLVLIDLKNNALVKEIPSTFGNAKELQYIDLSSNILTGSVPLEIASLSNLKTLKLQNNALTGNVEFFCAWETNWTDNEQFVVVGERESFSYTFVAEVILDCD